MKKFFVIMGLPRSGTTALRTALCEHSKIHTTYELFNEAYNENLPFSLKQVKDLFNSLYTHKKPIIGVHQNFDCPRFYHRKYVWDRLIDMSDNLIVVDRPNHLDRFISFVFAKSFNHWHEWREGVKDHNPDKAQAPDEIEIDLDKFNQFCINQNEQRKKMFEQAEAFKKHIVINYDDLNAFIGRELKKCLTFLDVPFERIVPKTKKFQRHTKITNLEEAKTIASNHQ